jgi:hypothetical protein
MFETKQDHIVDLGMRIYCEFEKTLGAGEVGGRPILAARTSTPQGWGTHCFEIDQDFKNLERFP